MEFKRPLLYVALLYVGGVVLADHLSLSLAPLFAGALGLALLSLAWARARPILLGPLIFVTGYTNLVLHTAIISPFDLRVSIGDRVEQCMVRGTLSETPFSRVHERGEEQESWHTLAQIEVNSVRFQAGDWQPAVGWIVVSTPGIVPDHFFAGQTVAISGVVQEPKGPVAEDLFDYRTYLSRAGIYYQLHAASTNDWQLLSSLPSPPVADRFCKWAQAVLARGLPVEDEPLRLLWAMTLGWKTGLSGDVAEPFMRSGTMHVFAISGLHIALIAGILVSLFRVCRVPRSLCGVVVVPLIWLYTGVTGWQASAIRSTIMMTVIIAGWTLRRPSDLLNSLAAAAFIILIWDPQQLFQASFQLSFFVVLSLALFTPVLGRISQSWLQPDPLLPPELVPRWRRWLYWLANKMGAALTTSLAAWLGSIPLVAYYFHFLTPISLLANLAVVPLSSLALTSNLASLIVGGWFSTGAEWFNNAAWLFMLLMVRSSEWAAHLPGGCFNVATPSSIAFMLYYAALVSLMAGWIFKPRIRVWVMAVLGLLSAIWLADWQAKRSAARLTILPLNGGDAIYLDAPGGKNDWLIDCGNASSVEFVTKPFLRAQGVNRLSHLLLTHGDLRHVGGAELIQRSFSAKQICFSEIRFRSTAYRQLLDRFGQQPGLTKTLQRGDKIGPWTVLHPQSGDHFPQADDNAIVLGGEFDGTRVLLLSDLGKPGQNALIQRNQELRAEIVVSGIPQSTEPLADALIDLIQPHLIVITDAELPATERASKKLRERLARRNIPVLYTGETGAVTIRFQSHGWQIKTMNRIEPPGQKVEAPATDE